jgi:hypothetical protein
VIENIVARIRAQISNYLIGKSDYEVGYDRGLKKAIQIIEEEEEDVT